MTTATDVANLALGYLHLEPVNNIEEDNSTRSRSIRRWLPFARRELLTYYNLTFAVVKRKVAVVDGIIERPVDMIKLIKVGLKGHTKYELVNNQIHLLGGTGFYYSNVGDASNPPTIYLYYVRDSEEYTEWAQPAVVLLALMTASRASHDLKPNAQLVQHLESEVERSSRELTASLSGELGPYTIKMDPWSSSLVSNRRY